MDVEHVLGALWEPPRRLKQRYRLEERLGGGGMAVLYRAYDEVLQRDVAIKFLAPDRVISDTASARFLREARAVARLSHPNIMTLYDVDREGAWHYLVLEHIHGRDLHALLVERGGPLLPEEAVAAVRGVLEALAYAHAQGVVHRDIKPQNIMLTPDGQVKVADFGLALARGDVRLTGQDVIVGTVLYMAPEALLGGGDHRADLYAVGAVFYELLTGQPPFPGDDPLAVASQVLNMPLTPPRQLNPRVPVHLQAVALRLLKREPDRRYPSAGAALADLPPAGNLPIDRADRALLERPAAEPEARQVGEEGVEEALADSGEVLLWAAQQDAASAVEAERRRLAARLQSDVIEPFGLLLAQAAAYEQSLAANPPARLAVSVLASLARQILQQARDLEANLHPTILESLGLEPALEALAAQAARAHGLRVALDLERLPARLPPPQELALFRAAQDALERARRHGHASRVSFYLALEGERLCLTIADDGLASAGMDSLRAARQRVRQLGGTLETGLGAQGGLKLSVSFPLEQPAPLTPREREVLALLAEGLSNKAIAEALVISPRTVNFHLDNIYAKLGVNSRMEAALLALRQGWVGLGDG